MTATSAPRLARRETTLVASEIFEPEPGTRSTPPSVAVRPVLTLAAFVVACAVSAACLHAHAMWFDEVQAWNIARASHSVSDLVGNLRYEGHPLLWYLPLFALTRVTGDLRAMQVLEWTVVAGTYAVLLFRAPFSFGVRVALVAGYFVTFEYGVMSRSYALGVLLLVLGLLWLGRPNPAWGRATVALSLLAWTSLSGGVLVLAIATALLWLWWRDRGGRRPLWCAGFLTASTVVAAVTCIPPADFVSFSQGIPKSPLESLTLSRLVAAAAGPWRGLFPVPDAIGGWNTNLLDGMPAATWIQAGCSVVIVALVLRALRAHRLALRVWLLGSLGYLFFSVVIVLPDRSHYAGEWFLLLLASVWLAAAAPGVDTGTTLPESDTPGSISLTAVFAAVVCAQVVATAAILPAQTRNAFSPDRALARAAADHGLTRDLVSGQDFDAVTMAGYLDAPVYSAARGEWIRFFVNDQREAAGYAHLTSGRLLCAATEMARTRQHAVAVVVDHRLVQGVGVDLIASSRGVRLYRVTPAVRSTPTC